MDDPVEGNSSRGATLRCVEGVASADGALMEVSQVEEVANVDVAVAQHVVVVLTADVVVVVGEEGVDDTVVVDVAVMN